MYYECVQFQIDIWKISCSGSRSLDKAKFGHFTSLFCIGQQIDVPRIITHIAEALFCSLSLLFGDILVAVAVVFCVMSLLSIPGGLRLFYSADYIAVNTWNMSGMFIVL